MNECLIIFIERTRQSNAEYGIYLNVGRRGAVNIIADKNARHLRLC
ncbi:Uncharacterised protein [Moraxella ovis]|nr:Uncharacterised protein [Moraxella ovis]